MQRQKRPAGTAAGAAAGPETEAPETVGRLPKLENVKCGGHVSITRGKSFQHALILQFAELQFAQLQFAGLQFGELRSKKQSFLQFADVG